MQWIFNRLKSFGYAFKGIADLFATQAHARIHAVALVAVVLLGAVLHLSANEWCLVILCIGAVLAAESFNTAIEYIVDLVSPNYHPLAGKAKDVAAAGVLLIAIAVAIVGVVLFLPKIGVLSG